MGAYVLRDDRQKNQDVEDRKIDRRYHWFIFMFIVVLGLAVVALVLSYFNGAVSGGEGFLGFNEVVKNVVWTGFTALFIFWALLVSIIRVREAYYEAEDYRVFARLSVIQFFYLWADLLILLFVVAGAAVMLLFADSGAASGGVKMDAGFVVNQDSWLGVSPFFVFYLLAFFSYCYLVFMLSFGYVKDLEIFESGRDGYSGQIRGIEAGLARVLACLEQGGAGQGSVGGYSDSLAFSGVPSRPVAVVGGSAGGVGSVGAGDGQQRARSLFAGDGGAGSVRGDSFSQAGSLVQGGVAGQSFSAGGGSLYGQRGGPVSQGFDGVAGQGRQQRGGPVSQGFDGVSSGSVLDSRLGYGSGGRVDDSYYGGGSGPSRVSQQWLANSLDTLSLPRPVAGASRVGQLGVGGSSGAGPVGRSSWDELLGAGGAGGVRGRRRIR